MEEKIDIAQGERKAYVLPVLNSPEQFAVLRGLFANGTKQVFGSYFDNLCVCGGVCLLCAFWGNFLDNVRILVGIMGKYQ